MTRAGAASVALTLALLGPSLARASDASLRAALATWSQRVGADARGIGLSAINRHPRRVTVRALHFRTDALHARRVLLAVAVSSARGRRAKQFALTAFADYARVGADWALAGRARLAHHLRAAANHARLAAALARRAGTLLIKAGTLLR